MPTPFPQKEASLNLSLISSKTLSSPTSPWLGEHCACHALSFSLLLAHMCASVRPPSVLFLASSSSLGLFKLAQFSNPGVQFSVKDFDDIKEVE